MLVFKFKLVLFVVRLQVLKESISPFDIFDAHYAIFCKKCKLWIWLNQSLLRICEIIGYVKDYCGFKFLQTDF